MLKKLFILLGFVVTVAILSRTFDGDFGWHLRFGQDAFAGNFQYLDTYTYPYFGEEWVNHEWGGDLVFWFLYSAFGYFSIVLFVGALLWAGFLVIQKRYFKRLTPFTVGLAILFLLSIKFLLVTRLAMVSALFFAFILTGLDNNRFNKSYHSWPIIFWFWSALHGSWILGFIIINIYSFFAWVGLVLRNRFGREVDWDRETFKKTYIYQLISLLVICANPYGVKILGEVGNYFTHNSFKQVVNEWLPSYSYPVYIWPLLIGATSLALIIYGLKNKKVSIPQAMVFLAIFFSAWMYKRNNLYLVLASLPIITYTAIKVREKITGRLRFSKPVFARLVAGMVVLFLLVSFSWVTDFNNNVWKNRPLLTAYNIPVDAVNFLKTKTQDRTISVFNEFWWGGYLNWSLPNALVYLDGRGTATWSYEKNKNALLTYREIKFEPDGIQKIESQKTEYVFLEKPNPGYPEPDKINSLIFDKEELDKIFVQQPIVLIDDLNKSPNWDLIYEDNTALIWQRKK